MISGETKTALVRLADATKLSIEACAEKAIAAVRLYRSVADVLDSSRAVARKALESDDPSALEAAEKEIQEIDSAIPTSLAIEGVVLQQQLHAHALAAIVVTCFTAEAYANALASYLLETGIVLKRSTDKQPFDRLPTVVKWERISAARGSVGLQRTVSPLSELAGAFEFRNAHAHAKVSPLIESPGRYGTLPDPVFGNLGLHDALAVAAAYWNVTSEAFRGLALPRADFERHYNLSPWVSPERQHQLAEIAAEYNAIFSAA